jgi:hypothetical protein
MKRHLSISDLAISQAILAEQHPVAVLSSAAELSGSVVEKGIEESLFVTAQKQFLQDVKQLWKSAADRGVTEEFASNALVAYGASRAGIKLLGALEAFDRTEEVNHKLA